MHLDFHTFVYACFTSLGMEVSFVYTIVIQGEYIDTTIGVTLGISTMAAAGIGNMISDLAGLGLADQVSKYNCT